MKIIKFIVLFSSTFYLFIVQYIFANIVCYHNFEEVKLFVSRLNQLIASKYYYNPIYHDNSQIHVNYEFCVQSDVYKFYHPDIILYDFHSFREEKDFMAFILQKKYFDSIPQLKIHYHEYDIPAIIEIPIVLTYPFGTFNWYEQQMNTGISGMCLFQKSNHLYSKDIDQLENWKSKYDKYMNKLNFVLNCKSNHKVNHRLKESILRVRYILFIASTYPLIVYIYDDPQLLNNESHQTSQTKDQNWDEIKYQQNSSSYQLSNQIKEQIYQESINLIRSVEKELGKSSKQSQLSSIDFEIQDQSVKVIDFKFNAKLKQTHRKLIFEILNILSNLLRNRYKRLKKFINFYKDHLWTIQIEQEALKLMKDSINDGWIVENRTFIKLIDKNYQGMNAFYVSLI